MSADRTGAPMRGVTWWLRIVGALYLLLFVMAALVKTPIAVEGPPGALGLAAAGDPLARFLVDTWVTLGLFLGAAGAGMVIASRRPTRATALVWTVCGIEVSGIITDAYKIVRGYETSAPMVWIVIHTLIIGTALVALGKSGLVPYERA